MNIHVGLIGGTGIALFVLVVGTLVRVMFKTVEIKDRTDLAARARQSFKDENEIVAALIAFTMLFKWALFAWAATIIWAIAALYF